LAPSADKAVTVNLTARNVSCAVACTPKVRRLATRALEKLEVADSKAGGVAKKLAPRNSHGGVGQAALGVEGNQRAPLNDLLKRKQRAEDRRKGVVLDADATDGACEKIKRDERGGPFGGQPLPHTGGVECVAARFKPKDGARAKGRKTHQTLVVATRRGRERARAGLRSTLPKSNHARSQGTHVHRRRRRRSCGDSGGVGQRRCGGS
jgi:hypothetical protein